MHPGFDVKSKFGKSVSKIRECAVGPSLKLPVIT